MKIAEI